MEVNVTFVNDCDDLVWSKDEAAMARFYANLGWFPMPNKWLTFKKDDDEEA